MSATAYLTIEITRLRRTSEQIERSAPAVEKHYSTKKKALGFEWEESGYIMGLFR